MVLMPPARLLRSAAKALRNSIANTAVSSASRPCGTFGQFFPQMFRNSNWSVVSDSSVVHSSSLGFKANRTRAYVVRCSERVVGQSEAIVDWHGELESNNPPSDTITLCRKQLRCLAQKASK